MDRFERQRRFFGREGQDRIRATRVGIIGVGGLGVHVAQQLAYLGVGSLIVVDRDRLAQTDRNRLIGARADDPNGTPKVEIAARTVDAIDPEIEVEMHQLDIRSGAARTAVRSVGWLFGCVDNDGARLLLTEECAKAGQGYVDLASDVDDNVIDYGGRVCVAIGDSGCLYCLGLLSQENIRESLADDAEREDLAAIYGVPIEALGRSGPSLVYLNGIIASLGVAEFAAAVTGLRTPVRHLEYRGRLGIVTRLTDPPSPGCPYCALRTPAT